MGKIRVFVISIILSVFGFQALHAADNSEEACSAESKAFDAIRVALSKTKAGDDKPTEPDFVARRVAGNDTAELAKKFLRDFPNSKKAEEVNALLNLGLFKAAVVGDQTALTEIEKRAREIVENPKVSDEAKQHAFIVNYMAQWAHKNGKREINDASPEGRVLFCEALFASADALANKESILQSVLLLARSPNEHFSDEQRAELAKRVLDHPAATDFLKATAKDIIAKKLPYEMGKPIDLKFTAMDGREVDLANMRGKVVVVVFWATWCGPCVAEFPMIRKTYEKYHDKGLEVVGISLDDDKEDLVKFLKKNEPAPWPQYFDGKGWNNQISFRFTIAGVPTIFIIDKKGNLAATNPGTLEGEDVLAVESYLKQ
jgi:thiol-disulfide isomerase/thioredoxin